MSCVYSAVSETFVCFTCGENFEREEQFKEHLSNHVYDPETFKASCPLDYLETGKHNFDDSQLDFKEGSFHSEIDLLAKLSRKDRYKEIHTCSTCGKEFKRKDYLNKHSAVHNSIKAFPCLVCGKSFSRKDRLKEHCVVHLANGWSCYFCGRMFSQRCILRKHEMIHRGVKPFSCELCDWKFSRKNDLVRHFTTHTGEKNHLCEICGKGFSQRRLVKRHLNVHKKNQNMKIIIVE